MRSKLPITKILDSLKSVGAIPLYVGGCVRDTILGIPPKDFDVEVFQIEPDTLYQILSSFGDVDAVGKSFGIFKMGQYDFSIPGRENKNGRGHKGFMVDIDPTMTIKEACARRDFTINSIAYDPFESKYLDPFNGIQDIQDKVLRHTSDHFSEDPLRVLRGMQFAGRFGMTVSPELLPLCKITKEEYPTLALERIWGEWYKWAEKSTKPSMGMDFLLSSGWIDLYPDLCSLISCKQDVVWHPEGNVWEHTRQIVDAMVRICDRENISGEDRVIMIFAALCHDIAKPQTTELNQEGRIISPAHCKLGGPLARKFIESIGGLSRIINKVAPLIEEHLIHTQHDINYRLVRRLSMRLHPASIKQLVLLIEADHTGRFPLQYILPSNMKKLTEISNEIKVIDNKPKPVVMGRDLLAVGFSQGKEIGIILKKTFEAQLDGAFSDTETGVKWVCENFPKI